MEQLSLFDTTDLVVGSYAWREKRFFELDKLSFEELENLEKEIFERYHLKNSWFSDYDYYTSIVITDIFHFTKIEQFKKKYPKAEVYLKIPPYL